MEDFIRTIKKVGYIALFGSGVFLAVAAYSFENIELGQGNWSFALTMMAARTLGIASFLCGAALLVLEQWSAGALLFICSTVLPCVSFWFSGTI